jgi:hypothetical protein
MKMASLDISLNMKTSTLIILLILLAFHSPLAKASNESSFSYGYQQGSLTGPQFAPGVNWNPYSEFNNNTCAIYYPKEGSVIPAITNTTSCLEGFFAGWKNWCSKNAVDCVQNMTVGDFPEMIMKTHQEYLRGYETANGSGNSMCPIGNSGAFCQGWNENNGDYGNYDCGDIYVNYTGPFSNNLIGCPLDSINPTNMAKPHQLIGKWNYLNESATTTISGNLAFSSKGNFTLTVPNPGGDYTLEGSWGNQWKNLLTLCYAGGCSNSTLITIIPNHIEFKDNHDDRIHLIRDMASSQLALSPYQSGYKHGLNGDYPNLTNHTAEYTQGFIDGYCKLNGPESGSDADQGTFECDSDTTVAKSNSTQSQQLATNVMMPDGEKLSWDWHLLPSSSHSIQWDDGYKAGYMGLHSIAELFQLYRGSF